MPFADHGKQKWWFWESQADLMLKQCERCSREFDGKHNARWCADCRPVVAAERERQRRASGISVEIVVPDHKQCGRCGETKPASAFSPQMDRPNGLTGWCKACRAASRRQYRVKQPKKQPKRPELNGHLCKVCGTELVGQQQNVCRDGECHREWARRYNRALEADRKPMKVRNCKECGNEFVPEYGNKRRVFCSDTCLHRWTRRHGKRGGDLNGRARHYFREQYGDVPKLMYQYINWSKVLKRDGWRCGICGQLIDSTKKCPEDGSPSVDHVIPLSKGGSHLYSNVQAAHFRCNWEKGADD